jgi:hypothetical protein
VGLIPVAGQPDLNQAKIKTYQLNIFCNKVEQFDGSQKRPWEWSTVEDFEGIL